MVTHEVWFEGRNEPVLQLRDDDLFQQFTRWLKKGPQLTAHGWEGTFEGKPVAINFAKVTYIALLQAEGWGDPGTDEGTV
jgi:hypothetical protein